MSEPQDLFDRLSHGDEQAMREVYQRCGKRFLKWASRQFSGLSRADRLDAWHDAFYTLLVNLDNGKIKRLVADICTYLTAIGRNCLLKRTSHHRRTRPLEDCPPDGAHLAQPTEMTEYPEDRLRQFYKAVQALSPQKRRIVELRYIEGKSVAAIREIIGYASENAVSVTLSRALQEIRDGMNDKSPGTA
jgi:RNA polymerase sigma factor (sigma-70 family)